MTKQQTSDDIQSIRKMMEESTRFLSLSGLSGIFPGIIAIAGAVYAYVFVLDGGSLKYDEYMHELGKSNATDVRIQLGLVALCVFLAAISSAWFFSWRKANKTGKKLVSATFKKLLFHLLLPVAVGGIFSLLLVYHNNVSMVASAMLVFYGLALINAGKFTFTEIHYLGLSQIVLGLLAAIFIHYGLLFWTLGFGLMHIVYGTLMYLRHK